MIAMAIIIALMGGTLFLADRLATHLRWMEGTSLKDAIVDRPGPGRWRFSPACRARAAPSPPALALGLKRETAARFSFLLSAPIIAGAGPQEPRGRLPPDQDRPEHEKRVDLLPNRLRRRRHQRLSLHPLYAALPAESHDQHLRLLSLGAGRADPRRSRSCGPWPDGVFTAVAVQGTRPAAGSARRLRKALPTRLAGSCSWLAAGDLQPVRTRRPAQQELVTLRIAGSTSMTAVLGDLATSYQAAHPNVASRYEAATRLLAWLRCSPARRT